MRKVLPLVMVGLAVIAAMKLCSSPGKQDPAPASGIVNVVPTDADAARDAEADLAPEQADGPRTWPPLREGTAAAPSSEINYYIVFDGSGSMRSFQCGDGMSKMDAAVLAVRQFINAAPSTANIGLAAFDSRAVSERVPLGVGNRDVLASALEQIRAGSGTPLNSGIRIGYKRLTDQARTQLGYGEYHLVVVTDGKPEPSSEDPTPVVQEILRDSPVVLHTIGFCIDANHVLNQPGRTFYASATSPQELQSSLQAVLAEAPSFDVARFQ